MSAESDDRSSCRTACAAVGIHGLNLWYGENHVLRDIELEVAPCGITALIGPSGCGKSSLLSSINRLTDMFRGCRVEGRVRVNGTEVYAPDTDVLALRRRVGMIFQRPNPFPLSILHNITIPLRECGMKGHAARVERAERALGDVGLFDEVKDRLDESALLLSGGQQQRLCIARAMALEPEVLLFDEPCSSLDPLSSSVVEELIEGLRGAYTVLIVTHDLAQAHRIADNVGMIWARSGAGQLIEFGARDQVFDDPHDELTRAYVSGMRG